MLDIIIPMYNVNKYIEICIESVIGISQVNLIVVNDGSTEDMSWIKKKYSKYTNFKYYKKENGGLSSARNYGLEKAKSEYVLFLDGDDFLETEELIKNINKIKITKKDAYFFNFRYFYEDTQKIKNERKYNFIRDEFISFENKKFIKEPFIMIACRYILKRDILIKNKLFFKEGIYHEDEEWTPRILATFKKIYNLNSYMYMYRQREGSITSNYNYKHIMDLFTVIKSLSNYKENVKEKNSLFFFNRKIVELYKILIIRSFFLKMELKEEKQYIKELKCIKKHICCNFNFKNMVAKYIPYKILRFLLKRYNINKSH